MRKVIIFGNGLGRALNHEYFDLRAALFHAWSAPGLLNSEDKALIVRCIGSDDVLEAIDIDQPPGEEDQLDDLQRVLAACDEISSFERDDNLRWLSDHGRRFPTAIRTYIHCAATYFHNNPYSLPNYFVESLAQYILNSKSHVATLNYDELLYRAFLGREVFNGYNCLIDGFVPNFSMENLQRRYPTKQAFYMHLHGSPLYQTQTDGRITKQPIGSLVDASPSENNHIVLTHVKHKRSVIQSSEILSAYWERLEEALNEVNGVILFGYSGQDELLNSLLYQRSQNISVEIVERFTDSRSTWEFQQRQQYWASRLGQTPEIWPMSNVLEFHQWNNYSR